MGQLLSHQQINTDQQQGFIFPIKVMAKNEALLYAQ